MPETPASIISEQTKIKTLGTAKIDSPLDIVSDIQTKRKVLFHPYECGNPLGDDSLGFDVSGPEKKIYFDPKKVSAAIVTCGGICPGLNNVIRAIVLSLYHGYGVRNVYGIRYGLEGFIAKYGHSMIRLTPEVVSKIHELGGTILGSSRGAQDIEEIVDTLERQNLKMLFVIGGDGSLRAASKIEKEVERRGLKIAVVGIPKTIDNDISYVHRSFGFETAVDVATRAIQCAHAEAASFPNGVGLVKVMGRHSGYIAATASIAQRDVNFVLIPEDDFDLEGPNGFLQALERRLEKATHAVVVVAEGAGQKYFEVNENETDKSGNVRLKDIGIFMQQKITEYFEKKGMPLNLKYIDPSYMIRSVAANTNDGLFCAILGQNAVHAAMAGKTGMVVSSWYGVYCQVPIDLAVSKRKVVNIKERLWMNVLEATGQKSFRNAPVKAEAEAEGAE